MSVWFVTGASRGFGREIVEEALRRGHQVVATARRPETLRDVFPDAGDSLLAAPLDVTDADQVHDAVAQAINRFGRIDVLVNNAGHGTLGAVEEVSDAEARSVFDVNVFGLLSVTRAVLPVLRRQGSGTVINISSSGGFVSHAGWGVYCATKFAVEALGEALRQEVAPLGVAVTTVEPGGFRTDFLDGSSLSTAKNVIDDYAGTAGSARQWAEATNHAQQGDPAKAARVIVDLAGRADLPERLQLGEDSFMSVADKITRVRRDQAAWRDVSLSTAHDDA
ncbi:oxidoreductase [Streptomyces sp. NBC_01361]|uniref:oxidoreductase n=1 Tax=Streptomyces sp. NBC_01361 TaxID=2903838 RepID=UPI002E31E911|nr:oxidoreductase [Streptomyces sp. NBC_01361]